VFTLPFVAFTGFAGTKEWFRRQDSFDTGTLGTVSPTSALLVELRQRQIMAVLNRAGTPKPSTGPGGAPGEDREGGPGAGPRAGMGVAPAGSLLDLCPVDEMYEQAMSGPLCGPLLRLFLAQYIR
jgi:hypothetical protein